jgi:hypothetical protein
MYHQINWTDLKCISQCKKAQVPYDLLLTNAELEKYTDLDHCMECLELSLLHVLKTYPSYTRVIEIYKNAIFNQELRNFINK